MDTSRPHRPRSTRKPGKVTDKAEAAEVLPGDAPPSPRDEGRVFDDLDLAAYIEELLSVKVDAIGTNLERTLSDRLIDLVETNQRLAESVEAVRGLMGDGAPGASGGSEDARARIAALEQQVAAAEARAASLQEDVYRLRDERANLKSALEALEERDRQAGEREQALRNEVRQSQVDLVGMRADLAAATRQLNEARQSEQAARAEATRAREDLTSLRAERTAQRQNEDSLPALRDELQGLRASEARVRDENGTLQAELARLRGRENAMKGQAEEIERLENVITALQVDLTEARQTSSTATNGSQADRERAREGDALVARCTAAEAARDEAARAAQALGEELQAQRQLVEDKEREVHDLAARRDALQAERDRLEALALESATRLDTLGEEANGRIAAAQAEQRQAEERLTTLETELRAEIETLTSKKNALTETLRTYSDPEKFRDIKLREMHQSIETLRATMREKDNLLSESGKEQLLLGQELEKLRKEKYESQVLYERRIKELQESLQREVREKEKERDERHLLEEQLAKTRKKWPLW